MQGGLRVFLKYSLPIFVVGVILTHRLSHRALMAAMRVALFLIVARIVHLTAGIQATSGQFYTPYRLAEELVFYLAFVPDLQHLPVPAAHDQTDRGRAGAVRSSGARA